MVELPAKVSHHVSVFRILVDDLLQETKIKAAHRAVIDIKCKTQKAAIYGCRTDCTSIQYTTGSPGAFLIERVRDFVPLTVEPVKRPLRDDFASIVRSPVMSNGPSKIVHITKVGPLFIHKLINSREQIPIFR